MMNAVGIDVSKRKSTVTILRPGDKVILDPVDILHTRSSLDGLIGLIDSLDGDTKVCMECTGRYYETAATLPEYPVVMAMRDVGPSLGPQLIAYLTLPAGVTRRPGFRAFDSTCMKFSMFIKKHLTFYLQTRFPKNKAPEGAESCAH